MATSWEIIDRLRQTRRMNLVELAEIGGVSPPAVQQWKAGGGIKLECIQRLADHFDVSVDELLGRTPEDRKNTAHARAAASWANYDATHPRENASHTPGPGDPPAPPGFSCRYPADCDIAGRLASLEAEVHTLTRLLGARLALPESGEKRKAG